MRILYALLIALLYAKPSSALDLGIPIACDYGFDCFIESYYDHSKEANIVTDHACGRLSYDGHKSTDFILKNHSQMKEGVNVVAGDSGVIKYVRDGMSDVSVDLIGEEAVRGRECGNGIIIDHKRGYTTEYCHLKRNSITVKVGDEVEKGDPIAQVGLSGNTTFPYLEFTVRNGKGAAVDPFTGEDPVTGSVDVSCDSLDIYPLWDKQTEKNLDYISTAMLGIGFSEKVPHASGAREGKYSKERIKNNAHLLVLWTDIFGIIKGDDLKMSIIAPDGSVLASEVRQFTNNKRHMFQFMGKKPTFKRWPLGEYIGKIELIRKDGEDFDKVINETFALEIIDANAQKNQ